MNQSFAITMGQFLSFIALGIGFAFGLYFCGVALVRECRRWGKWREARRLVRQAEDSEAMKAWRVGNKEDEIGKLRVFVSAVSDCIWGGEHGWERVGLEPLLRAVRRLKTENRQLRAKLQEYENFTAPIRKAHESGSNRILLEVGVKK